MPTTAQAIKSVILCQYLSNGYKPINVFRYDSKSETIYIQAGENDGIALIIFRNGSWRFENQ
ncbi:MAG: hypothetical protein CLLPBCKN_007139 [Chroococcidiopsis cubana SAG 39.79]|uniref:DUF6888 domain-containing protein n=1 Tax=Chroococcidiopsis cubana SAG 39.79 TaxID=388085 RepID=A0AB37UAR0_9CYAN|nr:hypothetical protein [Chroococcidiopsis cubana]MDZ4877704.1 hypothetical protein [Chroococcidiopsis cubana SAG 39.79]OWY64016.1 hypothetical protein B7486_49630 [cyanobacterium TDX16]PSB60343.1 hypothetical protein C7B79_26060 [Chroococcidiopsis cubana CCALA 043]RUT02669.1 hypothetical protein DSM107010_62090 [Chroococcidiopsis cubana SAG 39.79]